MTEQTINYEVLAQRIAVMSRGDEDKAQAMWLALLEKQAADPTFAQQQIGYHVTAAKFAGMHFVEKSVTYDRWVGVDNYMDKGEGEESMFDSIASENPTPEQALERKEQRAALLAALATLPTHQRKVAEYLLAGMDTPEIAKHMGTSVSSVCHMVAKAKAKLADIL